MMEELSEISNALPEISNANEVAKYLRVSKRTLLREVETGKLEAFRVGKSLRFYREAVKKYIKDQKVNPGERLEESEEDEAA